MHVLMLILIKISKSINRMGMGNQKTNDIILILCNLIFKIYKYFINFNDYTKK